MLDFMPEQASNWAKNVDWINNLITDISVISIVLITAAMLYFAVKYRRSKAPESTSTVSHNTTIETVWTVIPTVVCLFVFYFGYAEYKEMRNPPSNALEINVLGQKWNWSYTYPNGKTASEELVVPLGKPVRMIMTSSDVLHSFFIPAMRVKEDVIHGVYSHLWFTPTKLGVYHIFCAEYCGTNHSGMLSKLKVVTPEEFEYFLADRGAVELTPQEAGQKVFKNNGCNSCHSIDGSALVGPSLKGLFARKAELEDGSSQDVDENYIRESIFMPQAKIAKGYAQVPMTSFQGRINEEEMANLIAYLKTL